MPVSGSDDQDTPFLPSLRELGVTCHLGYAAAHLGDLGPGDTVVVTTAAREDNPEVLEARRRGLRLLPRSAGLAAVMAGRRVLAVAGTHGKTTTTGLLTSALLAAGADPTYAVGGVLTATGRNADAGSDDLFVAEADESDGAFLVYRPHAAIVTNVEADHLDNWGTEEAYHAAFDEFAGTIDRDGFLVVVRRRRRAPPPSRRTPGPRASRSSRSARATSCDLRLVDVGLRGPTSRGRVLRGGTARGRPASCGIPGRHYVLDAAGGARRRPPARPRRRRPARPGWPASPARAGGWSSRARRRECASTTPTPTTRSRSPATCRPPAPWPATAASSSPSSPTSSPAPGSSATQMGVALGAADEVVVLDVYLAREDADPSVTGALVADAVPLPPEHVLFEPDFDAVPADLVGPRAPRRPGADPRRRQHHPARPPGPRPAAGSAVASATGTRPSEHGAARAARSASASRAGSGRGAGCTGGSSSRVLAVVALVATSVWLVFFSAVLAVAKVEVDGNRPARPGPRPRGRRGPEGEQLALVDLEAISRRVAALAEVEDVDVTRSWPDGIRIDVTERTAIAVVELGGRLRGLDAEGVVFRDYRTAPKGMPRVRPTTSTGSDALAEAAGVVAVLPSDLAARVDHVEVQTIDQITLVLRDGRQVLWGSAEQSELKARVLPELLAAQRAQVYDVSVPESPITRPS